MFVICVFFIELFLILHLSRKTSLENNLNVQRNNNQKVRVINLKRFFFLSLFNLIVSWILIFLLPKIQFLRDHLGFSKFKVNFVIYQDFSFLFTILMVFPVSLIIYAILDRLLGRKFAHRGLYLVAQDKRKFWFVLLFSLFLIALTLIAQTALGINLLAPVLRFQIATS